MSVYKHPRNLWLLTEPLSLSARVLHVGKYLEILLHSNPRQEFTVRELVEELEATTAEKEQVVYEALRWLVRSNRVKQTRQYKFVYIPLHTNSQGVVT